MNKKINSFKSLLISDLLRDGVWADAKYYL